MDTPGGENQAAPLFVGRQEELAALASHLVRTDGSRALVHGPAGIGKSALIRAFTSRYWRDFPGGMHVLPGPISDEWDPLRDAELVREAVRDPSRPSVVVFEEAHLPYLQVDSARVIGTVLPRARFIAASRSDECPHGWLNLALTELPKTELAEMFSGSGLSDDDVELLVSGLPGNPLLAGLVSRLAQQGVGVGDLRERLGPSSLPGLLGPNGVPLSPGDSDARPIEIRFKAFSAELLAKIEADPDIMRQLSPRAFEEFVASLYERHGFHVELTPQSADGGVDLYAVRYEPYGRCLTIVDCKRYAVHRPVQVGLVRHLRGVIEDKGASVGVLATTSTFTKGARKFQEAHGYRIGLQDWFDLQDMLRKT